MKKGAVVVDRAMMLLLRERQLLLRDLRSSTAEKVQAAAPGAWQSDDATIGSSWACRAAGWMSLFTFA